VEAVRAALLNSSGQTIIYEETSGTSLVEMPLVTFPQSSCDIEEDWSDDTCDISFQLIGQAPGQPGGGATGQASEIVWQYELSPNQTAALVAEGSFIATTGATSLANAQAWVASVISSRPAWVPASLISQNVIYEPVQVRNQNGVFNPTRATIVFKEPASAITLPVGVAEATYGVSIIDGELDIRASAQPSNQFLLAGQLTVRTEGNTTFDSSLSKIAPEQIVETAETAVASILGHFDTVYGDEDLRPMQDAVIETDLTTGVCTFRRLYESGSITRWDETTTVINDEPTEFTRASDGTDWAMEPEGGPIITVEHSLVIESVGTIVPYRQPQGLTGDWYRTSKRLNTTFGARRTGGLLRFTTVGGGMWRYVNKTPKGPSSKLTGADVGSINQNTLGSGQL
jgi:hypothetical protein